MSKLVLIKRHFPRAIVDATTTTNLRKSSGVDLNCFETTTAATNNNLRKSSGVDRDEARGEKISDLKVFKT